MKSKCHRLVFGLFHSGKAVDRIYSAQSRDEFLQGYIEAFDTIGGIPTRHIRYDNLTSAVTRVLFGRCRDENERSALFRSQYGFHSFCCEPGFRDAYENGEVGRFPRNEWLADCNVDANPHLNPAAINTFATGDWLRKGQSLCLIGNSVTGKSLPSIRPARRQRKRNSGSNIFSPPESPTNSSMVPTTGTSPAPSPARVASTYS